MSNCCNCDSEINLDGSGQLGRYLKALDPSYASIDDRSIKDLLVFARRYANQVRFYDIPGSNPGQEKDPAKISWTEFFRRDMAVIFASIGVIDLDALKKDYDGIRAALDAKPGHHLFSNLFDPILGIAVRIDKWYALAIPENPLHDDLKLAIDSNLKTQMQKIVAYEEGFKFVDSQHPLKLDYTGISNKVLWGLNDAINADITIYQGLETADRLRYASLYVDDIFNSFYGFLKGLVQRSEGYMQYALEQYPAHQPHMALFISFLQLFRLAQDQMNGITGRMLDFYYRDVLQLTAKPAIPDKAYIVFELAKDITEFDIAPGTTLKATPDAAGIDQVYATETDLVVNQAKVKELKTIFINKQASITADAKDTTNLINTIYARPVAKSLDGFGAKFTDPNPKWPTFGKGKTAVDINQPACKQIDMLADGDRTDQAEIGFAIASPELLLQGGKRLLEIGGLRNLFSDLNQNENLLEIWLTGEKGWIKVDQVMTPGDLKILLAYTDNGILDPEGKVVKSYGIQENELWVYLPVSEKSVIAFDPAVHPGFEFITEYPVARIMIKPEFKMDQALFTNLKINNISLATIVGSINPEYEKIKDDAKKDQDFGYHYDGLKTLVLQNDLGLIAPPDQPFDPFTPYPAKGKTLYIGSDEVFNKNLVSMAVNLKYVSTTDETPTVFGNSFGVVAAEFPSPFSVSLRQDSDWILLARKQDSKPEAGFSQWSLTENILNIIKDPADATTAYPTKRLPVEHVEKSPNTTDKGFIKIENEKQVNSIAGESILQASQDMAQGFQVKEISLSYFSFLPGLDSSVDQFFHLYPFGVVETFSELGPFSKFEQKKPVSFQTLDAEKNCLLVDAHNLLLPQFNYVSPYAKYNHIAATMSSAGNAFATMRNTLSVAGNADAKLISSIMNSGSSAARLMLDASGLVEKTTGSDNQYSPGFPEEGMLFIGIENLQPLQMVSMLFQFAEGSAENEDDKPPSINWSYLTCNEWRPLKAENIVSDSTYGFQTTGIIKIDTPEDASSHNTIITDGLIWFCASVSENTNRIPQLIDVVTQAVEAQFQDNNNDPSHYDKALPAASISQLVKPVAQIASVNQPFQSFDGKHKEVGKEFYIRVSERLRHKGRAITAWDYEHLILDRFPGIYKVKCIVHTDPSCNCRTAVKAAPTVDTVLPASVAFKGDLNQMMTTLNSITAEINNNLSTNITLVAYGDGALDKIKELVAYLTTNSAVEISGGGIITNNMQTIPAAKISWRIVSDGNNDDTVVDIIKTDSCCGPQIAPGHVLIIPVSDFKNRNSDNPLQPKTGRRTLLAIEDYLSGLTSPFVHVHAKNPEYDEVIVSFKVRFYDGIDRGFYMKKLNDEIVQFLTPWAFDENADVHFDQKIYASSVIDFIEKRTYVDFITEFEMGVCCSTCCPAITTGAFGTVSGKITDEKEQGMAGVLVKIKDLNMSTTTADGITASVDGSTIAEKGTYSFDGVPNGEHVMVAYFSLFSTVKKIFTTPDAQGVPAVVNITHSDEALNTGCGCEDIEYLLEGDANFQGDIVAKPCNTHSILVSVPHHIIIPYEDPDPVSPCPKPAAVSQHGNNAIIADKTTFPAITPFIKKNIKIPPVIATPKEVVKEKKGRKTVKKPASVKHPKKKNN